MDIPLTNKKRAGFIVESEYIAKILRALGFKVKHDPRLRLNEEMMQPPVRLTGNLVKDEFDFTACRIMKPNRKR